MRQTFSPHFVEMLAWYWCEVSISTLQFFIVPALHIWLLPSWDVHFISVWLHPPICLNKAVQPSGGGKQGGGLIYTHFKHFHVKVSTFYLSTMSPLDIRGEVCGFWFLAVLIPGTPTRKGWGWVGAFGVSKTEWSRPHPTPNNSFAPFWQMGNKPLPNARPLLQRQKDHQKTKCVCVSECLWHIVVWFPCFFLLVLKIV